MTELYDPYGFNTKAIATISRDYAFDRDKAIAEAAIAGLVAVTSDDKTLQLDFDTEEQWDEFVSEHLPRLLNFLKVDRVWWTESKSGNKHVYVRLADDLLLNTRIGLQASLGSDPTREFLNYMRWMQDVQQPILFFEKPDAVEVVIYAIDGYQPLLTEGTKTKELHA